MKRLYILRHAKSSWAEPGLGDIERPLNKRGMRQLERLQQWFSKQAERPEVILCSPSVRTRATHQGISPALEPARMEIVDTLYHGRMDNYLDALWSQEAYSVMIIGHNPTCDELARYLTQPSSPAAGKLMAHHFGTANMAIFDFQIDQWTELREASGQLMQLLRPRDLEPTESG